MILIRLETLDGIFLKDFKVSTPNGLIPKSVVARHKVFVHDSRKSALREDGAKVYIEISSIWI